MSKLKSLHFCGEVFFQTQNCWIGVRLHPGKIDEFQDLWWVGDSFPACWVYPPTFFLQLFFCKLKGLLEVSSLMISTKFFLSFKETSSKKDLEICLLVCTNVHPGAKRFLDTKKVLGTNWIRKFEIFNNKPSIKQRYFRVFTYILA